MKIFLCFVAAFVATVAAQGNLNSFSAIRNALREGSELQLNIDSDLCTVTGDLNGTMFVSMPMRHWEIMKTGDVEEVRADEFFVSTMDQDTLSVVFRNLQVFQDDTVLLTLSSTADLTLTWTFECALGDGAIAHSIISGNDLEDVDTYGEVKSLLLLGSHVEAVGELKECRNYADIFPDGEEYIVGFQIQRVEILGDSTPDELLMFDDVAVIAPSGTNVTVGVEHVVMYRSNDSVVISIGILDGNLQQITSFDLDCGIGSGIIFQIHERESDNSYSSYADIKEATLDGHDMEAVVFLEFCSTLEGPTMDYANMIGAARFDEFQLFEAGGIWGDVEYIAFSQYGFRVDGSLYGDVIRVYENETVTVEYYSVAPGATSEGVRGVVSCQLLDAVVFHAVQRTRAPITDFTEIVSDVINQGQIFEVEINYSGCDTGNQTFSSVFGGIVWQTYVNPDPEAGYYFGNVFGLVQQDLSGTLGPAWDTAGILVLPDGSVSITVALYDYFTGENLVPGVEPIQCQLGRDSVLFYRYP